MFLLPVQCSDIPGNSNYVFVSGAETVSPTITTPSDLSEALASSAETGNQETMVM